MAALVHEGLERQRGHFAEDVGELRIRRFSEAMRIDEAPRGGRRGARFSLRAASSRFHGSTPCTRARVPGTIRRGAVLFNHSSQRRTDDKRGGRAASLYPVPPDPRAAPGPDNAWRSPHEREVRRHRGRQRLRRKHHRLPARGEGHEGARARAGQALDAGRVPAQARRPLDLRRSPAREAQRMARPAILQEDDRGAGRRRRWRIAGVQQRGDRGARRHASSADGRRRSPTPH